MAKLRKPISLIVQVFNARTEGMSFNATCRFFKISKNTLWDWEDRMSATKKALLLYSLAHTFVSMIIEGDELYTDVPGTSEYNFPFNTTCAIIDQPVLYP